jgi:AmmeMemoRadiSam system protein A
MERSHLSEISLEPADASTLLDVVDETLTTALFGRRPTRREVADLPGALREPRAVFVTLHVGGALNGCIGTVDATEPLGVAASRLALSAAFEDPRLPALRAVDYHALEIEVSILSAFSEIEVGSRRELLAELRPGIDGVVVSTARRRGLFLPTVWDQLPTPEDFVAGLWHKAGLAPGVWPADLRASRFTTAVYSRAISRPPSGTAPRPAASLRHP